MAHRVPYVNCGQVIILGRLFLKTSITWVKLVAVAICVGGIACLVTADVRTGRNDSTASEYIIMRA